MTDVKKKMLVLKMRLQSAYPEREDREKTGFYTLYNLYLALKSAQGSVRGKPFKQEWIIGIQEAKKCRDKLDVEWGVDGSKGHESVKTHWSSIRRYVLRIQDQLGHLS